MPPPTPFLPDALELPAAAQLEETGLIPELSARAEYLFSIDEIPYFMVRSAEGDPALKLAEEENQETFHEDGQDGCRKFSFQGPAYFRIMQPEYQAFAAITAVQLFRWKESRKFCGCCGSRTEDSRTERALVCTKCGHTEYPKICPAIIVGVIDGERILLTKYAGRNNPNYALIAGFTEIGETAEETVMREVYEEVGVRVKNLRYYKTQPWGMASDLLIGYYAELDGDPSITLDRNELSTGLWMDRKDIIIEDEDFSLTREMIVRFAKTGRAVLN